MINSQVTMVATINRNAVMKQSRDGKSFISFGVEFPLSDYHGNTKKFDVSVSADLDDSLRNQLVSGRKVEIHGTMYFKKKADIMYMNLRSEQKITFCGQEVQEQVSGTLHFNGKIGKKGLEDHQDKRGKSYQSFSAWTGERDKEDTKQYNFIWVQFRDFQHHDLSCVQSNGSVEVEGDLQLSLFKDSLYIGSRVNKISPYVWQNR